MIIDSPPVMAVTDAAVVAHLANGVVFVVGAEMTGRAAAQASLRRLEAANANLIGGVLNRVNSKNDDNYYSPFSFPTNVAFAPARARGPVNLSEH